jgi:ERCC4-type nuclease
LRHFGSIHRIAAAAVSELTPFVGKKTAQEIVDHFERQRGLAEEGARDAQPLDLASA